jgi:hypothetical protein
VSLSDDEKQLRAAARRLSEQERSAGLFSRAFLVVACAIAVAIAAAGVVLIGQRNGGPPQSAPAAPAQYNCGSGATLPTLGPLFPAAHGDVDGHRWVLEIDQARHGANAVRAGRFLLDGRAYGICRQKVDFELIDATPHGIVYGFAVAPFIPPVVIEATTARGTASSPVPAYHYPATTRHVPGGTLFVRALPASACAYKSVAATVTKRPSATASSSELLFGQFTGPCHLGHLVLSR